MYYVKHNNKRIKKICDRIREMTQKWKEAIAWMATRRNSRFCERFWLVRNYATYKKVNVNANTQAYTHWVSDIMEMYNYENSLIFIIFSVVLILFLEMNTFLFLFFPCVLLVFGILCQRLECFDPVFHSFALNGWIFWNEKKKNQQEIKKRCQA